MELALHYAWRLHPAGLLKSLIAANIKSLIPVVSQFYNYAAVRLFKLKMGNDLASTQLVLDLHQG